MVVGGGVSPELVWGSLSQGGRDYMRVECGSGLLR
jgi:hypothetical protein